MELFAIEEFAARRRTAQENLEAGLIGTVRAALDRLREGDKNWADPLTSRVGQEFGKVFREEGGEGGYVRPLNRFLSDVKKTLAKTTTDSDPVNIATWLATAILNSATMAAADTDPEPLVMEWVTMHDGAVRHAHRDVDGEQRAIGETFKVGGEDMPYPGYPGVSIDLWINCRCALAPAKAAEKPDEIAAAAETEEDPAPMMAVPWHGVLAPEGVMSGDKRMFAEQALTWRDLPVPLTWQEASGNGHDGSVTVARIDQIARVGNELRGRGVFLSTEKADKVIGMIAEFGRFGVSIDADSAEFEFDEEQESVLFTSARIASASIVSIPAFAEAWVALGAGPEDFMPVEEEDDLAASVETLAISEKPWDGSASRFTPEEWYRACLIHLSSDKENKADHKLPIREPNGDLSRAGVHAAASRINQVDAPEAKISSAKAALRSAYKTLGEDVPESLTASVEFRRGPGWLTHPRETKRIHDYWTRPGEPGYEKIGWGVPGDFNRCRVMVGEEIGENSPEDLRFLNQICAQWHKDALGIWPGEHKAAAEILEDTAPAASVELVAANLLKAPAAWFADPELERLSAITVTDEGEVFGHLAGWSTCHVGFKNACVTPPRSFTNYAHFRTGEVALDNGERVAVGHLTIGGGHAGPGLSARAAIEHYDSTSAVVADVACGEDEHGIWVHGWVRPGVPDEMVTALQASALSGDWRRIGSNLELIAALAVNSPGFPIPRVAASVEEGEQHALVAAGVVHPDDKPVVDVEAIAAAVVRHIAAQQARKEKVAALTARVMGED
jgi:hypothetical protein